MSLEEEKKLSQNEWVRWLLNEDHKAELWEILAFGEKYKKEWEEMRKAFWRKGYRGQFDNLIMQYEDSKDRLMKWLPEEKGMLDGLNDIAKEKFYEEYLFDRIVYSWDPEYKKELESIQYHWEMWDIEWFKRWVVENKNNLKPWMKIDLSDNDISKDWIRMLAETWKDKLQPWMRINFSGNKIWDEWVKILAREWKGKIKPWMEINLRNIWIWPEWIEILAKEWKNSLKPWMCIDLWTRRLSSWRANKIWDEWAKILAEEWKNSLKPWMMINLSRNKIWDEWAQAIMDNLELKDWVRLSLNQNDISDKKKEELKEWVQWYKDRWINCDLSLWNLGI